MQKAVEQNPGMAVGEMLASRSCEGDNSDCNRYANQRCLQLAVLKAQATPNSPLSLITETAPVTLNRSFRLGSSALLEAIHSIREFTMPCRRRSRTERGQSPMPLGSLQASATKTDSRGGSPAKT
jgi:hypothetical protein